MMNRCIESGDPTLKTAQEVFDAVEEARIACIGSYLMKGVGDNLQANLAQHCVNNSYQDIQNQSEAPLSEALNMLIREKVTGRKPPQGGDVVLDLWRDHLEYSLGDDLEDLDNLMFDQEAFAELAQKMITDLGLTDEYGEESAEGEAEEEGEQEEEMQPRLFGKRCPIRI